MSPNYFPLRSLSSKGAPGKVMMASLSIPMSMHGRVGENWAQVWECAPMGCGTACLGYSLQKQAERGGGDAAPSRLMLSSLWPSPLLSERTVDTDSIILVPRTHSQVFLTAGVEVPTPARPYLQERLQ